MTAKNELEQRVTIGLCTKNSEKTIRECLESILDQDYPIHLMELLVVDGGSQDHTLNIIRKLVSEANMSVKFFYDEGKGISIARQIVFDNSRNKYVVFVDSDVLLSPDFVKSQVEFMQSSFKIAIAIGKFSYQKDIQTTLPAKLQGLGKYIDTIEWARRRHHTGFPANDASIYLVEASRQVGGFDKTIEGASEDEDIIMRLKNHGWSIALNEQAKFYALSRETWQALWKENVWFGYGKHFLSHKYKGNNFFLHYFPLIHVYTGLKQSVKCYRLTHQTDSFLLPLLAFFNTTSLYYGFIKAHKERYGHKENN